MYLASKSIVEKPEGSPPVFEGPMSALEDDSNTVTYTLRLSGKNKQSPLIPGPGFNSVFEEDEPRNRFLGLLAGFNPNIAYGGSIDELINNYKDSLDKYLERHKLTGVPIVELYIHNLGQVETHFGRGGKYITMPLELDEIVKLTDGLYEVLASASEISV
tara:strand:+ start:753 stop:1232 length:480 start_codon:yes stop_codon:yes gene_type:complete